MGVSSGIQQCRMYEQQIKTGGMAIITAPIQCSHMPLGTETF